MNIKAIENENFFNKKLIKNCYFKDSFIDNAVLSSFVEYSLKRNQINNHYYSNRIRNEYGEQTYLNPMLFQICEKTSFVTYYKSIRNNDFLFKQNLNFQSVNINTLNQEYSNCYVYKKKIWNFNFLHSAKNLLRLKFKELGHNESRSI